MAKLNQIIAIEKGIKSQNYANVTALHKAVQKPALFNGFSKTYQPNEEGENLPPESLRVQYTTKEVLRTVERNMTEMIDVTARKDYTNTVAAASVMIDGVVIIKDAPVPFLLFMEKQMSDMKAFVGELPVLDPAEDWSMDPNSGLYKAKETKTHRTKKVSKPIVLYPATAEHPAQTQMATEDVIAGFWSQVKQSGAMPKPDKEAMLERIETLTRAIKEAREKANMADEVATGEPGKAVFEYLMKE